jgi:hypothetical protein
MVKEICTKNRFPHKVLLLLHNAPGHPPDFSDVNTKGLGVKTAYLPANTTSLLQPMDQGAISTFKDYYLQTALKRIAEAIQVSDNVTLRDY